MDIKRPFDLCCWRFKESVKEGIIYHAGNYDETEWIISEGDHIYYCPYCGSYIKGEGFGRPPKEPKKINPKAYSLLREIIKKHQPDLEHLIDELGVTTLTCDQREDIRSVLATELCINGLDKNDEPNQRGLQIEELIDIIWYYSEMT